MSEEVALDEAEQQCVDDIAEFGCHILKVFDNKGELPDFAYSVGFPISVGQPEVIILGLRLELMHSMINEICRQCREDGLVLSDGAVLEDLIGGHVCVAKHCTDQAAIDEFLCWAGWYHRTLHKTEVSEFYQIVWPGAKNGLFPWDEGAAQEVIDAQPALYEAAA